MQVAQSVTQRRKQNFRDLFAYGGRKLVPSDSTFRTRKKITGLKGQNLYAATNQMISLFPTQIPVQVQERLSEPFMQVTQAPDSSPTVEGLQSSFCALSSCGLTVRSAACRVGNEQTHHCHCSVFYVTFKPHGRQVDSLLTAVSSSL